MLWGVCCELGQSAPLIGDFLELDDPCIEEVFSECFLRGIRVGDAVECFPLLEGIVCEVALVCGLQQQPDQQ